MFELINKSANLVLFMFCIWAILDKRCKTRWVGTSALSLFATSAFINIVRPEKFGLLAMHFEMLLNVAMAITVSWYWLRWRKSYESRMRKDSHVSH